MPSKVRAVIDEPVERVPALTRIPDQVALSLTSGQICSDRKIRCPDPVVGAPKHVGQACFLDATIHRLEICDD